MQLPRQDFEGQFTAEPLTPIDKAVREYHRVTELFDRTLAHSVGKDGMAQPHPGTPLAQSNRNAIAVRASMLLNGGFSYTEWVEANRRYVTSAHFARDLADLSQSSEPA